MHQGAEEEWGQGRMALQGEGGRLLVNPVVLGVGKALPGRIKDFEMIEANSAPSLTLHYSMKNSY